MKFKEYLDESPVGMVGRTGEKDAVDHVTPELEKEFMNIVRKMGGKTVARLILGKMNTQGNEVSPEGDKTLTNESINADFNDSERAIMAEVNKLSQMLSRDRSQLINFKKFKKIKDKLAKDLDDLSYSVLMTSKQSKEDGSK